MLDDVIAQNSTAPQRPKMVNVYSLVHGEDYEEEFESVWEEQKKNDSSLTEVHRLSRWLKWLWNEKWPGETDEVRREVKEAAKRLYETRKRKWKANTSRAEGKTAEELHEYVVPYHAQLQGSHSYLQYV